MAITSNYSITSYNNSWESNPTDHLPQSGKQVREFLGAQHNALDARITAHDAALAKAAKKQPLPIVHRSIPFKARVGNKYVFNDGRIKLRGDLIAQGWTSSYLDGVRVMKDDIEWEISYERGYEGVIGGISDSHAYVVYRNGEYIPSVAVKIRKSPEFYRTTGNASRDFGECFELVDASTLNGKTLSPNFDVVRGKVLCVAHPPRVIDKYLSIQNTLENFAEYFGKAKLYRKAKRHFKSGQTWHSRNRKYRLYQGALFRIGEYRAHAVVRGGRYRGQMFSTFYPRVLSV